MHDRYLANFMMNYCSVFMLEPIIRNKSAAIIWTDSDLQQKGSDEGESSYFYYYLQSQLSVSQPLMITDL